LALLLLPFTFAAGQSTTATLSGTVEDEKGAVIPGANVTVINSATGLQRETTTNGEGYFVVPLLSPSSYKVRVERTGFAVVEVPNLVLNIGDRKVLQIQLKAGDIKEAVTVESDTLTINQTDGSVSTVVDQKYVANMPLNGRSFQDLILLTPGVLPQTPQNASSTFALGKTGEFSVNGQRTESNNYTVDGVSGNVGATTGTNMVAGGGASGSIAGATALGTTQALVSVDALQEFRVQSSSYSAEYGRNPGGQFAFETKSGTNQFHGTVYDYLRNGFFDAQDWFNNYFRIQQPSLRQNDFGGTFGGPVLFPRFGEGGRQPAYNGRNKTFFFFSYEGLRLVAPQAASINNVPDASLRAATPSPLSKVLKAFPVANGLDDAPNGIGQFIGTWSNPSSLDSTSVRFDHAVNNKWRLFFRFGNVDSSSAARGTSAGFSTPSVNTISAYTLRTYTAGASSALTSRLSNELRLNYTSNAAAKSILLDAFGGSTPVDLPTLAGLVSSAQPNLFLIYGGYNIGLLSGRESGVQKQWNVVDTMSLSFGRHQLKVGIDYRRLAPVEAPPNPQVSWLYFSSIAVKTDSASTLANAFATGYPLYKNFSAFAQDELRVSQRLVLSLGLRWEVNPAPGVTQGLMPYTLQGSGPSTWTLAPQGTPLWKTTWYNFAPRLGVAYVLHNASGRETVVRGGGGVFFDTGQQLSFGMTAVGFNAVSSTSGSFSSPVAIPILQNPPPPSSSSIEAAYPHLQLPYTLQWNGSIEQAVGKTQAFTVSYVGAHAARLLKRTRFSVPALTPNTVFLVQNGLTSDYDALQVQFRRRLSRGLTALASYTWSHCIDYGSANNSFGYQRGNCDFDVRHNLSAAFSYDLPNLGGNGFVKVVLHHWGLDSRFTARSSFPVTLDGRTIADPSTREFFHGGLNLVPGQPIYLYGSNCDSILQGLGNLQLGQGCPGGRAINPLAFSNVSSALGSAPRNFARGFGAWQMNMAVRREFPIGERLRLQFRAEAFNIFNHPNFGSINSSFGNKLFGQATATFASSRGILNPLYQAGSPRSMQFALKLLF